MLVTPSLLPPNSHVTLTLLTLRLFKGTPSSCKLSCLIKERQTFRQRPADKPFPDNSFVISDIALVVQPSQLFLPFAPFYVCSVNAISARLPETKQTTLIKK